MKYFDNKTTKYLDSARKSKADNSKANTEIKEKKKKNARILCHDKSQYWTTQKQFWQWMREKIIVKIGDNPLTGKFTARDVEKDVILANTVLNLSRPRHLSEALSQRKFKRKK